MRYLVTIETREVDFDLGSVVGDPGELLRPENWHSIAIQLLPDADPWSDGAGS